MFANPTDVRTLLPFLGSLENRKLKFKNIIADAGYESEENYEYLFNNNYTPYINPQNIVKAALLLKDVKKHLITKNFM